QPSLGRRSGRKTAQEMVMPKILIHTMYFLPEFGSAPILMNELAGYLAGRGHEVEVITTLPRPPQNRGYEGRLYMREKRDGFLAKRFPTNFAEHPIGRLVAWTIYTTATIANLVFVRRGDVLFLRLPPLQLGLTGIIARRLKGVRFVLNVQDIHPDLSIQSGILSNPFCIRLAQAFEKWIYGNSETIAVISEGFKKNLLSKGVPPAKIHILPNWVDTDFIRPMPKDNPVARKFGLAGKFTAMYSGTISISSNLALEKVLEAAARLKSRPDMAVAIVGEGRKKKSLEDKAAALGLTNVVFIPFQPYADLPALLASADVLLVPLDTEKSHLSVPSKLYNFMAAGRPILGLADASSEVAELIASTGCGLCVPPDDPAGIAAAMVRLKEASAEARAMAERGRKHAESHYSRAVVLERYEKLLAGAA
ncbi:MAG: glycosyltransferase family 4 protein, partial [Candidatus Aminicenantes bacterium]|nr:glycosyltransferase family 4 protein [Candidatus Aminicenantes bacterium]